MLSLSQEEIERRAQEAREGAQKLERFQPFTVKIDIAREELDRYLANQMDLLGVDVVATPHRNYRYGGLGGHLIGYMNEAGPDELKRLNEDVPAARARGQGRTCSATTSAGAASSGGSSASCAASTARSASRWTRRAGARTTRTSSSPRTSASCPSPPGKNLVLSIDWRLQEFAEKTFPATAGVVLAMDAKTGFLLALVDRPAPDPNKMSGRITGAELAAIHSDPLQPELFRAIQQHYHPGSTFKALTSIAALEEGVYRPAPTVFCPGHFRMGSHVLALRQGLRPRLRGLRARARRELRRLLLRGRRAARRRRHREVGERASGSACRPASTSPGEVPGVVPDVAWHDRHLPGGYQRGMPVNLAIGQGDVNVTPMQQLVFYGALATGIRLEAAGGAARRGRGRAGAAGVRAAGARPPARSRSRRATRCMKGLLAAVNQPFGTAYWQRLEGRSSWPARPAPRRS